MQVCIAVDIGGTNTKLGVVSQEGKLLQKATFSTQDYGNGEAFLEQLTLEIKRLVGWVLEPFKVAGIGVGAPKANFYTGVVAGAANLRWQQPVGLRQYLSETFQLPVFVTNDANQAALGEKHFGGAREMQNFIVVTLGTGIGCGVYMRGILQHGQSDLVGELGHVTLKRKGRFCKCGKRGCLETYVSVDGLRRTALALMATYQDDSPMRTISFRELSARNIWQMALEGDYLANKVFAYTGSRLGYKLADLVALFNPEAIFLSGGLSNAGELLRLPALRALEKNLYKSYPDPVQLLASSLKDNEISLLGGGALVWEQLALKAPCLLPT